MTRIVESKFDITDNNRPDGGNARKYDIDSVQAVIDAPQTQFALRSKEMHGYYGHPNTLFLKESLQHQPSNVCVDLKLNGTIIEHTQEILPTESGKVVNALSQAGTGGWSWRCDGIDGGRRGQTKLKNIAGFDFVLRPSYAAITESINDEQKLIRNALIQEGLTDTFADQFIDGQYNPVAKMLQEQQHQIEKQKLLIESLQSEYDDIKNNAPDINTINIERFKNNYRMIAEAVSNTPFVLKQDVLDILATGVSSREDLQLLFESFSNYNKIDFDSLPLSQNKAPRYTVKRTDDWNSNDVQAFSREHLGSLI